MIFHPADCNWDEINVLTYACDVLPEAAGFSAINFSRNFVLNTTCKWFLVKVCAMCRPYGACMLLHTLPPLTKWATTCRRYRDSVRSSGPMVPPGCHLERPEGAHRLKGSRTGFRRPMRQKIRSSVCRPFHIESRIIGENRGHETALLHIGHHVAVHFQVRLPPGRGMYRLRQAAHVPCRGPQ